MEEKRQKCEVYSRIVGYIRPVAQWNKGKKSEYVDRRVFIVNNKNNVNTKSRKSYAS